ncbi:MAG: AAA family ATPase [Pseudonocardia sp.]|nr:AAA family ATPase [Pseudonocardia sp.]
MSGAWGGTTGPLLEREDEITAVDAAVRRVAAGEGVVLLLEGPAGIGKTGLLVETRRRATAAGLRVLAARGGALEQAFPFGVVRQLFEPALRDAGGPGRALAGAAAAARDVFAAVVELGGDPVAPEPSFASLHGLYWLTVDLAADGPLAIVVDDLHWCDGASLRFLAYLARRLDGLPVLVAGSLRPADRTVDAAVLGELTGEPGTVSLRPRPLSERAVAELLAGRLGGRADGADGADGVSGVSGADPAFTTACRAATGGNPLLLHELARALAAEGARPDAAHLGLVANVGPRSAARSVLVRLARLPAEAVRMARAAAVLGDGVTLDLVADLAGIGDELRVTAADALVRAEILRDEPLVGFVHPLVRDAVHHDVSPVERAQAHRRAARLLADRSAPVERVAAHLLAVPPCGEPWVVETALAAAAVAARTGAADAAVEHLRRALAEPPPAALRTEVLLQLGRAELLTHGPDAVEHLLEASEALADTDADTRAGVAQLLGRGLLFTGAPTAAADLARRAAAELPPGHDDLRAGLSAFEMMAVFFGGGDPATLRRLVPHRTLPVPDGLGAKMLAAVAAQEWAYAGGPSGVCAELARQALDGGALLAADFELLGTTALVTLVLADSETALDAMNAAQADAHRRGSLFTKAAVSLWRGFALLRFGDLADAERSIRTGLDEFVQWGFGDVGAQVHGAAFLSAVLRERGDLPGARRALERSRDPGDGSEAARYWCHQRLELLVAEGRLAQALPVSDDAARRFGYLRHPIDTPWRSPRAVALHGLGRHEDALALLAEELELARAWGAPGTVAHTLRILGTLRRDPEQLRAAAEITAGTPARLEHVKALAALGATLRRGGRVREAREPLRRAIELAEACSAPGLVEHARTELYAAGGRARTTASTGPGSLTASERRVVGLAVHGATNRDIAQALFVTPKTVELHLSNAYRKLGISSRRGLADALATA